MFKRICAAACLAATGAGSLAATNVTIYGMLDLGVVKDSGPPGNVSPWKLSSGVFNGSRLGFKGTEDLGDGLSALFVMEQGFQADTGVLGQGGRGFGRQVFVGLKSVSLGALTLGRQYTAYDGVMGASDPFGSGGAGRNASLIGARQVGTSVGYYGNRIDNDVVYKSPVINGFSADASYSFGEVANNSRAGRVVGASGGYESGPLYVRAAFQDARDAAGTGYFRNKILGGSYDFGVVKAYGSLSTDELVTAGVQTAKAQNIMVGAAVPVGSGQIMLSYIDKRDKMPTHNDASLAAVGYMYFMSKKTTLYASAGRISNKNAALYTTNQSVDLGTGNKSIDAGIRLTF